jgi:hypothetical protein
MAIDAIRPRLYALPARLRPPRAMRTLCFAAHWPWAKAFTLCWNRIGAITLLTALSRNPPHRPAAQRRRRGRYQASDTAWRPPERHPAWNPRKRLLANRKNPDCPDCHSNHTGCRRIESRLTRHARTIS